MLKRKLLAGLILGLSLTLGTGYVYHVGEGVRKDSLKLKCSGIDVRLLDSSQTLIITREDIMKVLESSCSFEGRCTDSINLYVMEQALKECGEVASAQVYRLADGTIRADILQRKPVIRFIMPDNRSYCCDRSGFLFEMKNPASLPAVTGNIPLDLKQGCRRKAGSGEMKWIKSAINLTSGIEEDPTWKNLISQIDVDAGGDFVLYPVKGDVLFIVGDGSDIALKLDRIKGYYECIAPLGSSAKYRTVNVKFRNQIICK